MATQNTQAVQGYKSANVTTASQQSAATALAANYRRIGWGIQNQTTNVLRVKLGTGASGTDYTWTLAAGGGAADGTGGSLNFDGTSIWKGIVSISGTTPGYSVYEILEETP